MFCYMDAPAYQIAYCATKMGCMHTYISYKEIWEYLYGCNEIWKIKMSAHACKFLHSENIFDVDRDISMNLEIKGNFQNVEIFKSYFHT